MVAAETLYAAGVSLEAMPRRKAEADLADRRPDAELRHGTRRGLGKEAALGAARRL